MNDAISSSSNDATTLWNKIQSTTLAEAEKTAKQQKLHGVVREFLKEANKREGLDKNLSDTLKKLAQTYSTQINAADASKTEQEDQTTNDMWVKHCLMILAIEDHFQKQYHHKKGVEGLYLGAKKRYYDWYGLFLVPILINGIANFFFSTTGFEGAENFIASTCTNVYAWKESHPDRPQGNESTPNEPNPTPAEIEIDINDYGDQFLYHSNNKYFWIKNTTTFCMPIAAIGLAMAYAPATAILVAMSAYSAAAIMHACFARNKEKTLGKTISFIQSLTTGLMLFAVVPLSALQTPSLLALSILGSLCMIIANKVLYDTDVPKLINQTREYFRNLAIHSLSDVLSKIVWPLIKLALAAIPVAYLTAAVYLGAYNLLTLALPLALINNPFTLSVLIFVTTVACVANIAFAKRGIDRFFQDAYDTIANVAIPSATKKNAGVFILFVLSSAIAYQSQCGLISAIAGKVAAASTVLGSSPAATLLFASSAGVIFTTIPYIAIAAIIVRIAIMLPKVFHVGNECLPSSKKAGETEIDSSRESTKSAPITAHLFSSTARAAMTSSNEALFRAAESEAESLPIASTKAAKYLLADDASGESDSEREETQEPSHLQGPKHPESDKTVRQCNRPKVNQYNDVSTIFASDRADASTPTGVPAVASPAGEPAVASPAAAPTSQAAALTRGSI